MRGNWERRQKEFQGLSQNLKQDPTNLELANRCWTAAGSWQCGRFVREAYGEAALASSVGAAAFARTYRELFLNSGESPRMAYFDEPLIQALKAFLPQLTAEDHSNVEWILQTLGAIAKEM